MLNIPWLIGNYLSIFFHSVTVEMLPARGTVSGIPWVALHSKYKFAANLTQTDNGEPTQDQFGRISLEGAFEKDAQLFHAFPLCPALMMAAALVNVGPVPSNSFVLAVSLLLGLMWGHPAFIFSLCFAVNFQIQRNGLI